MPREHSPRLERATRELRHAVRVLRRSPGFAMAAVLILGLGIGMATATFTVFDALAVRPLPAREPERVVTLNTLDETGADVSLTQAEIAQVVAASRTITGAAAVAHQGAFATSVRDGDRFITLRGAWVTGNFFDVLGAKPALGRFFDATEESRTGIGAPIVLSWEAWRTAFGGDSSVVGRSLGNPYTADQALVVGVAPPGLAFPAGVEYWAPNIYPNLDVVARLAPGATVDAARDEFLRVVREVNTGRTARGMLEVPLARAEARPLVDAVLGDVGPQLRVLVAAVALLLLIACVNVGNLVLLRTTARAGEIAVRRALGAGAGDIVRPLLWECVLLATCGGALGFLCAEGMVATLLRLAPPELPRTDVLRLAGAPLGVAAAVTLLAVALAALLPALGVAAGALAAPLRLDARAGRAGPGRGRLRAALVAAQVALALVMLAGAGLLARSLDRLVHVPLGYRAEHLTVLTLTRPVTPKAFQQQMTRLYDQSAPGIRAAPGVVSVTPVAAAPFYGPQVFVTRWASDRQTEAEARQNPTMPWDVAGPDYFRTFGVSLVRGRAFTDGDVEGAPRVVVVSRLAAERFWPGEDPVGKRMRIVGDTSKDAWHTVVGLAGDIRYRLLRQTTPTVFVPYKQWFFQGVVAVRTRGPIEQSLPSIRAAVRAAEPQASIARVEAIDGMIANQLALPRLSTLLLASFGGTALLLAVVGLYGVMGAAVRERARELGIRAALGATPGRLVARVLAQAGTIALAGSVVGIAGALLSARLLRALLYEVSPADPVAVLGAAVVLLLTALAAAFVQARRATRIDPVSVLRAE